MEQRFLRAWCIGESGAEVVKQSFAPGGPFSIDADADGAYASSVAWKVACGWPTDQARAGTLLASRGSAALARSLWDKLAENGALCRADGRGGGAEWRRPSAHFALSSWRLTTILWERTWRAACTKTVAPRCYSHLEGEFGLAAEDASWRALVDRSRCVITTYGFASAMVANERSFPEPRRGYCMPVITSAATAGEPGVTRYELVDSDVVCFVSSAASAGACRSLIETDDGVYRLPPFATVTLLAVHAPGEWAVQGPYVSEALRAEDRIVQRRCFEVSVAF